MTPVQVLDLLMKEAPAIANVVRGFKEAHPELIDEDHPDAPPPAPESDIDPEVAEGIADGKW